MYSVMILVDLYPCFAIIQPAILAQHIWDQFRVDLGILSALAMDGSPGEYSELDCLLYQLLKLGCPLAIWLCYMKYIYIYIEFET